MKGQQLEKYIADKKAYDSSIEVEELKSKKHLKLKSRARKDALDHEHDSDYDDCNAIEFEKLDVASFKRNFFDKMEEINYARYID